MLFTRLKISNFFCFEDSELDLSYPKKVKNTTIENEYLEGRPYFNIKKVCIISGPNASGKTSLGAVLLAMQNILYNEKYAVLGLDADSYIADKAKPAFIEVDIVHPLAFLACRVRVSFFGKKIDITLAHAPILKKDSCFSSRKKLDQIILHKGSNIANKAYGYREFLSINEFQKYIRDLFGTIVGVDLWWYGWQYSILNNDTYNNSEIDDTYLNADLLEKVMKTFDQSIVSVKANTNIDDNGKEVLLSYILAFKNGDRLLINSSGDVLPTEGSKLNKNRLSRGTYDSIKIANFIARVNEDNKQKNVSSLTYFLDEGMNFVHTELEQAILNLIISKLHPNAQFFYTTHNYDIFEMSLPPHSFIFAHKEEDKTVFTSADIFKNKNDRSLLPYVQANYFKTIPDTTLIDELLFED